METGATCTGEKEPFDLDLRLLSTLMQDPFGGHVAAVPGGLRAAHVHSLLLELDALGTSRSRLAGERSSTLCGGKSFKMSKQLPWTRAYVGLSVSGASPVTARVSIGLPFFVIVVLVGAPASACRIAPSRGGGDCGSFSADDQTSLLKPHIEGISTSSHSSPFKTTTPSRSAFLYSNVRNESAQS